MKNILKKILNNKKTKKIIKKKAKPIKKILKQKKVSKIKKAKKITKEIKKKVIQDLKKKDKVEVKTDQLRIPKNNEQKSEIQLIVCHKLFQIIVFHCKIDQS